MCSPTISHLLQVVSIGQDLNSLKFFFFVHTNYNRQFSILLLFVNDLPLNHYNPIFTTQFTMSSSSSPTINFFINYNQPLQGKKITVPKSTSINQLRLQALTVYKIDPNNYEGQLYHNGKLLDGSLPIRLTNLLNNAKLNLKTIPKLNSSTNVDTTTNTGSANRHEINVKFINDDTGSSKVQKCSSGLNLIELIEKFNGDISRQSDLRIVNVIVESEKYRETTLESIVGKSNNVVVRLKYRKIDNDDNDRMVKEKQEEAIRLHIEQESIRKKKVHEQEKVEQSLKEQQQQQQQQQVQQQQQQQQDNKNVDAVEDAIIEDPKEDLPHEVSSLNERQAIQPKQENLSHPTIVQPQQYTFQEEEIKDTPQLYIPSNKQQALYENPDEDYELTLNQAKTYQNMIRDSAKRKPKSKGDKPISLPNKYQIRIKFPDASILQINFIENVHEIKFGNLIKKIDELLLPKFINIYNLKHGHPPFKTIDMSYSNNNEYLYNLPDFQQERIMLIWELQKPDLNLKGPYIKNDNLNIKQSEELPERVLERHRGELPSGTDNEKRVNTPRSNTTTTTTDNDSKSTKKPKVPKWFKMK